MEHPSGRLVADEPESVAPHAPIKPDRPGSEGRTLSIVELLRTTREVGEVLTPVRADDAFRSALRADLLAAARRQHALWLLYGEPVGADSDEGGTSRRLVWGAAAVGLGSAAVSVLGALAYYWRRRGRKAA